MIPSESPLSVSGLAITNRFRSEEMAAPICSPFGSSGGMALIAPPSRPPRVEKWCCSERQGSSGAGLAAHERMGSIASLPVETQRERDLLQKTQRMKKI